MSGEGTAHAFARELITWRLAEGCEEGSKYVAREAQKLIGDPMLMVATVMALVEGLAAAFGTVEAWREHLLKVEGSTD